MNELFGVSMNLIMYVLLALLGVALGTVAFVFLRNRVMFKIGVRNIPRRRAQTVLIVLGLMLSTLIISAAFTTGDTVNRSITSQAYNLLGSVDETIQPSILVGEEESAEEEDPEAVSRATSFEIAQLQPVMEALEREPLIDAVVPVYANIAAAVNEERRLSSPRFTLAGVDPERFGDLPDLKDEASGDELRVADLRPGEMYLNKSGAEELDARPGDSISVSAFGRTIKLTVRAVVEDKRLAGSGGISARREGGVVPISVAQELFNGPGQATYIAVSNIGGIRSGLASADEVAETARAAVKAAPVPLSVFELKSQTVEFAEQGGSILTTFFLALGLFAIGAGVLLIFMIFVMLAAERKPEMGMARAVGTKRADLVQTFLSEGMSYNVLAAAVGAALGVGVAVVMANVMASLFGEFIEISPHVTPRSLIISYSLGVVLTFITVTFSSWRISNINIVRAIRDIPEPPMQRPIWSPAPYSLEVQVRPERTGRNRLSALARPVLAFPFFALVTVFLGLAAQLAAIASWFSIILTGRQPRALFELTRFYLKWRSSSLAFASLLTDRVPSISPDYPVRLEVEYPERRNRLFVLARGLLLLPHLIGLAFVSLVWLALVLVTWIAVTVLGRCPRTIYDVQASYLRWYVQVEGFGLLLRDEYPPFPPEMRLVFKPGATRAWAIRPALLVLAVVLMMSAGALDSTLLQILAGILGAVVFISFIFVTFQFGPLLVAASVPLIFFGASELSAFPLYAGLSFLPIGLALLLRSFGTNERITYTTAGLLLLYIWLFDFEFRLIDQVFGEVEGNIEMFFLSGVMITVASVFLLVYNADIFAAIFTRLSGILGAFTPSFRMAVAYPLANRARTGMTMAMFCLVVFALIVMSTMNYNFSNVFVSDRALGGWDVYVDENPSNPISDIGSALEAEGSTAADSFAAIGTSSFATQRRAAVCEVRAGSRCRVGVDNGKFEAYRVIGEDGGFLRAAELPLQTRAKGYADDDAVWAAVARDPVLAVIDANAVTGGFGAPSVLSSVPADAETMEPVDLVVVDRRTRASQTVTVIGVMELGPSNWYFGLHVSNASFDALFGEPDFRRFNIQTKPGSNNREVAREIESALLNTGAQAESLRYTIDQQSSLFTGFFRLLQGFMGLGLFVGVAAVGVIAFRTVVERRQQIGMLRALGYTRGMVGLTFLLESAFIAAGGITTGIVFGLILASYLISDEFSNQGVVDFVIPYIQVAIIGLLSFGSALLMTILPSRQAASLPIATALRYE